MPIRTSTKAGAPAPSLEPFAPADIPAARRLWARTPGLGLSESDRPRALTAYLERNPGLSQVIRWRGRLAGTVLAGHDGRRGFLWHLAVAEACQGRGWGRALVERALVELTGLGIPKTYVFVLAENRCALDFWRHLGWKKRRDLVTLSF